MSFAVINNTLYLNLLSVKTLETLFVEIGKLQQNEFSVVTMTYVDGSNQTIFAYPTDFTSEEAYEFLTRMAVEISELSMKQILTLCQ